jgi:predicted DCC family thiol-disulfide oxidoreductase YuxK
MTDVLLRQIIGDAFDGMPETVQRMHGADGTRETRGISRVMGGRNPVSRLIGVFSGMPRPVRRAPVHIRFIKGEDRETWDRRFGASRFTTVMQQNGRHLTERLVGFPVTFIYDVAADRGGFSLHVVRVRFLGIPLPRLLRPTLAARAGEWRGRYRFSTLVGFWFCGRVVSYFGYLDPPQAAAEERPVTIVFDGMCHLCSGSVAWIARRVDRHVRFVPARSGEGAEALNGAGLDALDPASFLVVQHGRSLQKSAAVVAVLDVVGGGWKIAAWLLRLLPQRAADAVYVWVAANRYKWFGRRETCFVPRR